MIACMSCIPQADDVVARPSAEHLDLFDEISEPFRNHILLLLLSTMRESSVRLPPVFFNYLSSLAFLALGVDLDIVENLGVAFIGESIKSIADKADDVCLTIAVSRLLDKLICSCEDTIGV